LASKLTNRKQTRGGGGWKDSANSGKASAFSEFAESARSLIYNETLVFARRRSTHEPDAGQIS